MVYTAITTVDENTYGKNLLTKMSMASLIASASGLSLLLSPLFEMTKCDALRLPLLFGSLY